MSVWHSDGRTPKKKRPPTQPSAPIEQRDAVYRALVAELGLSDCHRRHLERVWGLPPYLQGLFASFPTLPLGERKVLARRVGERAGCPVLGVAGFCRPLRDPVLMPLPCDRGTGFTPASALLIPLPDHLGRIQAMKLRADDAPPGARRYTMFSSPWLRGGASSGTPVAVWRSDLRENGSWLTEGPLKGLIAATRLDACVLATCGVWNWRPALAVLKSAPAGYPVVIAYDVPDLAAVPEVWKAREALAQALRARGFEVRVAIWEGSEAKGVDDALLAGLPVRVEPWRRTLPPLVRPRGVRLAVPA